jgi:hypothetical protein
LLTWKLTFPFMSIESLPAAAGTLLVSLGVSVGYLGYTWAAWTLTRGLGANRAVQFLSRNTVIVFIVHMPVYYLLEYLLRGPVPHYGIRVSVEFVICFLGLSLFSEAVCRVFGPVVLRDRMAALLWPESSAPVSVSAV